MDLGGLGSRGVSLGGGPPPHPRMIDITLKICDGIMCGVSRISGVGFRGGGVKFIVTERGQ